MVMLGRHVSIAGSIDQSFGRAQAIGCTAMQIFVTNPRGWAFPPIADEYKRKFRSAGKQTGIKAIAHMPYLPNIATSNSDMHAKSTASLIENMKRCSEFEIGYLVTHMGSHLGSGKEKGLENVVDAVEKALDSGDGTKILLENEAGHKNSVGDEIKDLLQVYDAVGDKRVGFCLDTCHLFAAGYDITSHKVLDEMFEVLPFEAVHAIHLNDAKEELNCHLDRHDNIGFGHIGEKGFRSFLAYKGITDKIIVLETPEGEKIDTADEIKRVWKLLPSP